ncbi:hypothetical protein AA0Y32_01265 [Georgenia phoenicis]|uniref:hypothetical protein n=1 Tax=unclassified Georgenia TaxID=2626815 RepID=UPI0039AF9004
MSDDDSAQRLRRPSWRDPRLGVGVLLVAASVALGSWTVAQADRTTEVLLAVEALTPGDRLADAQLRPHAVRPDGLTGTYLAAGDELPEDAVVTRVVGEGELVPAAAVGSAEEVDLRPVVVALPGATPSDVVKGAAVDLWLTAPAAPGVQAEVEPPTPELLAERLVVSDLLEADTIFAGAGGSAVQVLVPRAELPAVLGALSGEGQIVVLPVPGA